MKLSWKDFVNTLLVAIGGVIVYARLQDFSWWFVNSWRGTVVTLAVLGLAACIVAASDMESKSIIYKLEMWLGGLAALAVVFALITGWQWAALTLAGTIGALWLVSTARHTRHSLIHDTPVTHHGAYVH